MPFQRPADFNRWRFWPAAAGPGRAWRIFLHSLIGFTLLGLFVRQVDFAEVVKLTMRAAVMPIIWALGAYALDFLLRALRFRVLLEATTGRRVASREVVAPFVASFGISDLLPLRAGDAFRLIWFQRMMGLPAGLVLGAMLIERFYDLAALLLLAAFLFAAYKGTSVYLATAAVLVMAFFTLTWIAAMIADRGATPAIAPGKRNWRRRLLDAGITALRSFAVLRSTRRQLLLFGLSLLCWILEAGLFFGAWISLGGAFQQWGTAMAGFTASTLGTLFPGLPGHFGTFELFGLEMFSLAGVSPDFGASVLLLAHLLLWAPTALFAVIWLSMVRRGRRPAPAADQSDGAPL